MTARTYIAPQRQQSRGNWIGSMQQRPTPGAIFRTCAPMSARGPGALRPQDHGHADNPAARL